MYMIVESKLIIHIKEYATNSHVTEVCGYRYSKSMNTMFVQRKWVEEMKILEIST